MRGCLKGLGEGAGERKRGEQMQEKKRPSGDCGVHRPAHLWRRTTEGSALESRPGRTHLWYCVCRNWNSSLMRSRVSGYVSLSDWGGPDAAAAAAAAAATTEAEEPGGGCKGA